MHQDELDKEEKREQLRHRRLFVWGVIPSMAVLWCYAIYVAFSYSF
ncbi:hypothetical protein SAMN04489759_11916 [Sulfitobacter delicatus]|uniref:Uncharacterized protein n=1 Tax=Sulfitobacter delicatus TaxID=218672 RepID=A0A1G7Z7R4_9RHOB|nr:hypothetical protein SAMN04489759_11916 [Sulfitobacter delicatus]